MQGRGIIFFSRHYIPFTQLIVYIILIGMIIFGIVANRVLGFY